jgi:ribosomal protein S17
MRKNGRLGKVTKIYKDSRTVKVKVVDKVYVKRWKTYKRRTKGYIVESKFENIKPGNTVLLRSCRPYSSQKKWEIVLIKK